MQVVYRFYHSVGWWRLGDTNVEVEPRRAEIGIYMNRESPADRIERNDRWLADCCFRDDLQTCMHKAVSGLWTVLPSWLCVFTCDQGRVKLVRNFVPISSKADCFCWLTSIVTSGADRPKQQRDVGVLWFHSRKIYTNKGRKRCAMVWKKTLIVLWCDKNPIFFLMLIKAELFSLHTTSFDHSWINTENKFILKVAHQNPPRKKKQIPNQN